MAQRLHEVVREPRPGELELDILRLVTPCEVLDDRSERGDPLRGYEIRGVQHHLCIAARQPTIVRAAQGRGGGTLGQPGMDLRDHGICRLASRYRRVSP